MTTQTIRRDRVDIELAAAITLAKPGRELELILDRTKYQLVAIVIPFKIPLGQIEIAYALGHGVFSDCVKLAQRWKCWAVLADPAWADLQIQKGGARPEGTKFFFAS